MCGAGGLAREADPGQSGIEELSMCVHQSNEDGLIASYELEVSKLSITP
jgi:hypothetical protein